MKTDTLTVHNSNGATTAFVARPDDGAAAAVLLIQEWWGLNDHIFDIARRYANEGYVCVAPDLFRGTVATDTNEASQLMNDLALDDGVETIRKAIDAAKEAYGIEKFGITGYCMGGTFTLRSACEIAELRAAAPFYGDIPEEAVLSKLKTPTLFIAGKRAAWINPAKVAQLKRQLRVLFTG